MMLFLAFMLTVACQRAKNVVVEQTPQELLQELGKMEGAAFMEFDGLGAAFIGHEAEVDSLLNSPEMIDSMATHIFGEWGKTPTAEDKEGVQAFAKLMVTFMMKMDHLMALDFDESPAEVKQRFDEAKLDLSGYEHEVLGNYKKRDGSVVTEYLSLPGVENKCVLITGRFNLEDIESSDKSSIFSMVFRNFKDILKSEEVTQE